MNSLYSIIGTSKQGFHQWLNRQLACYEEQENLSLVLRKYREDHPHMSCRQMYFKLNPQTMGRDHFESFCHDQGYKVEINRKRYKTTDSRGVKRFPNLFLDLIELPEVNRIWVSDITYYEIHDKVSTSNKQRATSNSLCTKLLALCSLLSALRTPLSASQHP
jgi:putative transposase